jgi:hypothetical protein
VFPPEIYRHFTSPPCPSHLILLDLMMMMKEMMITGEEYNSSGKYLLFFKYLNLYGELT